MIWRNFAWKRKNACGFGPFGCRSFYIIIFLVGSPAQFRSDTLISHSESHSFENKFNFLPKRSRDIFSLKAPQKGDICLGIECLLTQILSSVTRPYGKIQKNVKKQKKFRKIKLGCLKMCDFMVMQL